MTEYLPDFPLLFLNREEAATVDALVGWIIPDEEESPGARTAGVTEYIDRALAGFLRELQPMYRSGLLRLAELANQRGGTPFHLLPVETQEALVDDLGRMADADTQAFEGQFFRIVREHTVQGFFGDPAYGGNRDEAGWKLVGFPGAQWGYTPEQMAPGFDARTIPILTIKDLYTRIGGSK